MWHRRLGKRESKGGGGWIWDGWDFNVCITGVWPLTAPALLLAQLSASTGQAMFSFGEARMKSLGTTNQCLIG